MEKLSRINGYYYQWKDASKDQSVQVGVIAQEIEAVLPEVVSTDVEGYKSVDYSKLTALLIEVNKVQQGQLEQQATEIEALKDQLSEVEQLKKRLAAIKQLLNGESQSKRDAENSQNKK